MCMQDKDKYVTAEVIKDNNAKREFDKISTFNDDVVNKNRYDEKHNKKSLHEKFGIKEDSRITREAENYLNNNNQSIDNSTFATGKLNNRYLTDNDLSGGNNTTVNVRPIGKNNTDDLFKNSAKANLLMQKSMMSLQTKIAEKQFNAIQNLNKGISDISTFQRTIQSKYYEASLGYKKDILQELKNMTAILKVGFNIKETSKGRYEQNKDNKENTLLERLFSGKAGEAIKVLGETAKKTAYKNMSSGALGDITDLFEMMLPLMSQFNGKSLLKMTSNMIGSSIFKKMVGYRQGEDTLNWLSNPKDMFEKFSRSKAFNSKSKFVREFFKHFEEDSFDNTRDELSTFNIKDYLKINTKDRAIFDQKAHKALTFVIPTYLANMEKSLDLMSRQYINKDNPHDPFDFNYDKNQFQKRSKALKDWNGNAGGNYKKVIERAEKHLTDSNSLFDQIYDASTKSVKDTLETIMKDKNAKTVIAQSLLILWQRFARRGSNAMDIEMSTVTEKSYSGIAHELEEYGFSPEDADNRARWIAKFWDALKLLRTEDAKYLMEEFTKIGVDSLYYAYEKDKKIFAKQADNNGLGAVVSGFGVKTATTTRTRNGIFANTISTQTWNKENDFIDPSLGLRNSLIHGRNLPNVSNPDDTDNELLTVAHMVGGVYEAIVWAEMKAKRQMISYQNDSYMFKMAKSAYEKIRERRIKEGEKRKHDIDAMTVRYHSNGGKMMMNEFSPTGDIMEDLGSFQKFASEYISTVAGKKNAKLAISSGSGALIYNLVKNMGGGRIMSPIMGVMGAGALMMTNKLDGVIEVLGEEGDLVMENGKTRRENLMYKVMQDMLPAGFAAKTGINTSKFIKNHLRFGGIIGPILGTIVGTSVFALGKSGLFKGLIKGATAIPRWIFKKVFGESAYNEAGKWINEKTGGFFDGSTPTYNEIFNKSQAKETQATVLRELTDILKSFEAIEKAYIKEVLWTFRGFNDNLDSVPDIRGNISRADIEEVRYSRNSTVTSLARIHLTIDSVTNYYNTLRRDISRFMDEQVRTNNRGFGEECYNQIERIRGERRINEKSDDISYMRNRVRGEMFGRDEEGRARRFVVDGSHQVTSVLDSSVNVANDRINPNARKTTDVVNERMNSYQKRTNAYDTASRNQRNNNDNRYTENLSNDGDDVVAGGAIADRRAQKGSSTKFSNGRTLDEIGCAVFVMAHMFTDVNGSKTNPEDIMELAEPYLTTNGVHLNFFQDLASRHGIPYVTHSMRNTATKNIVQFMKSNRKNVHIVLISKYNGHGHFIYVKNVTDTKCSIYDPLNPNRKTMDLGSILMQANYVITYGEEQGSTKGFINTSGVIVPSASEQIGGAGISFSGSTMSTSSFYVNKNKPFKTNPIEVIISGGHIDTITSVGSVDMDITNEQMKLNSTDNNRPKSLRDFYSNIYRKRTSNKYTSPNKKQQDIQDTREAENTEYLGAIASGIGVNPKEKNKDNQGGLLGKLAGLGLALPFLGGGPGNILGFIPKALGGIGGMFTKRFLDKNGKNLFQRGKQTFIDNPKKAFGLDDADSIGSKMLRNFKNKIFGFKEVNTKQLYEVTSDMYTKIGDEGIEKLARYEKAGLRTKLRAGTVDEIIEHKGLVGKIIDFIKKVGDNLANILFKHKFTRKIMEECKLTKTAIKTVFNKIAKKIGVEAVEASGEMVAKKGFKKLMGNIGTWAGSVTGGLSLLIPAGIIIWDTIQGYNKAPLWLNSPKPTMLQKFSCALTAGFISFVGNSGNPSIYVQVLTTFLEMSDSIMGMISGLIYGALNAIVGETPNTGKKDYTEGEKARYSVVDMGNGKSVVVEGKDAAKKWTNQTAGEIALGVGGEALSSTIQSIAPGVNNLSEALVFVLAQLADVLSGGVIGAYNGFQYANMRNNAVNVNVGGQGSGRGNSLLKDSPSGGITSKTASGLMFISQKKFMNNRLLGGESLTANGCAISCMKMIANHIGLKVSDSSLIETARKYLDKTNNGVKLEYFTNYGGQVTENYESVKNNLLTSKGNSGAIFLIKKNNGLHYVVVLNNKGRLYFGDPEEEDFLEMSPSSNLFEKALNCVYFGPNNGLLSTYRLGDRKGVFTSLTGRGPFKSVGFTPGMSRIIKGKEKMNSARKFNKKDEKEDKNGLGEININLGGNSTSTGTTSSTTGAVDSSLYKGALEPAI